MSANANKLLGVVCLILIFFSLGYSLGHQETDKAGCCIHPLAQGRDWVDLMAAFAGPIAIAIAIGGAFYQQYRDRQFQSRCKVRLAVEVAGLAKRAVETFAALEDRNVVDVARVAPTPTRPVFTAIAPRMFDMADETILAALLFDGQLQQVLDEIAVLLRRGDRERDAFKRALADLLVISAQYVRYLRGPQNDALPHFIKEVLRIDVPSDMRKMCNMTE